MSHADDMERELLASGGAMALLELACAAADAWAHASQKRLSDYCDAHHYADGLPAALDALELATRNSPLRKVKP